MVQRKNCDSVNYLTSIIHWIHNNPPPPAEQQKQPAKQGLTTTTTAEHQNKTNPRQQLLFARHLKRNRHRSAWRALPEFDQQDQENMMEVADKKLS
jgi:hypothetical protein